jgi:hypothetical protein
LDSSKIPISKQTNQQTKSSFFFNTAQDFSQPNSPKEEEEKKKLHNNNDNTTLHSTKTKVSKAQLRSKLLISELYCYFS